jgi:hypothetical protein
MPRFWAGAAAAIGVLCGHGRQGDGNTMDGVISRIRTRRAKAREKRPGRPSSPMAALRQHPLLGLLMALAIWAAAVAMRDPEVFAGVPPGPPLFLPWIADALYLLAGLLATGLALQVVRPATAADNGRILMLCLAALASLAAGKLILALAGASELLAPGAAVFLLPFALAPMLVTMLADSATGLVAGLWTALAASMVTSMGARAKGSRKTAAPRNSWHPAPRGRA